MKTDHVLPSLTVATCELARLNKNAYSRSTSFFCLSLTYKVTAGLLVIKDANVSATGVYQCMARNLYGNKLSSSFVDVKEGL